MLNPYQVPAFLAEFLHARSSAVPDNTAPAAVVRRAQTRVTPALTMPQQLSRQLCCGRLSAIV